MEDMDASAQDQQNMKGTEKTEQEGIYFLI